MSFGNGRSAIGSARRLVSKEEILAFATDVLRSVWSLEVLLLLYRDPAKSWPAPDIVAALRASTRIVQESLAELAAAGLAQGDPSGLYRFAPASPVLAETVAALSDLYDKEPRSVIMAILTTSKDKIQMFADAFRFKK